ncbi:MAG: signal recognition particle protein [Deltaproteobacteria bacterium]|nr:signal recognition particle protein [Deltaproteobacteria bacterium]MBW2674255.1 signal recognition particle protein [Deltaproteobacteria bacterium]
MFENLTEKLDTVFKKLRGRGILDEENVKAAMKDIRMALLEADVNFRVTKEFIEDISQRAIGREVLDSITPGQQIVKIVHDRLVELMGTESSHLNLSNRFPAPIMLVGLQGCGKTTTAAKLARHLKDQDRRVSMVSVDVYRPAAIEQLQILGEKTGVNVYDSQGQSDPVQICVDAAEDGKTNGFDALIIDTAGRLHIDDDLMDELKRIKDAVNPSEILFVADAMTGQDAVSVAETFDALLNIDGVVLTKMDGDARGGAALSLKRVTGKPVKFIGMGEKTDELEVFHPERMASRILGMGDILTLVEKAQTTIDEKTAQELERKIRKDSFTLNDLKKQLAQIQKMGSLQDILGMIPGLGKIKGLKNAAPDGHELVKTTAIIDSMTEKERINYKIINGQRRKRIARGSGTTVQDVNKVLKNYIEMRKMMKKLSKGGMKSMMRGNLPFK